MQARARGRAAAARPASRAWNRPPPKARWPRRRKSRRSITRVLRFNHPQAGGRSLLHEPRGGGGVALEELQEQLRDLLPAGLAGVGAVARQVLPLPDEAVALAGGGAVR